MIGTQRVDGDENDRRVRRRSIRGGLFAPRTRGEENGEQKDASR